MRIEYTNRGGKTEAQLSAQSDWELFNRIAKFIEKEFYAIWSEKADGLDQRYWDFVIGNTKLTLHLEHYLGISLFPAEEGDSLPEANKMVQTIAEFLKTNFV